MLLYAHAFQALARKKHPRDTPGKSSLEHLQSRCNIPYNFVYMPYRFRFKQVSKSRSLVTTRRSSQLRNITECDSSKGFAASAISQKRFSSLRLGWGSPFAGQADVKDLRSSEWPHLTAFDRFCSPRAHRSATKSPLLAERVGQESSPALNGTATPECYDSVPNPSLERFSSIAASSRLASACCSRHCAASRAIFSSNGSPSSSCGGTPTYRPGVST